MERIGQTNRRRRIGKTENQTDGKTERIVQTYRDRKKLDRQINRQRENQTDRHTDRQIDNQTDTHKERQLDRQTEEESNKRTKN